VGNDKPYLADEPYDGDDDGYDDDYDDGPRGRREPEMNILAIVSLITGVISLPSICCCLLFPFPMVSLVTGGIALSQIGKQPRRYKGKELAIVGIVCGVIGLLGVLAAVVLNVLADASGGGGGGFNTWPSPSPGFGGGGGGGGGGR